MIRLRRLLPARQTAQCAECRAVITERWRRPCPTCGCMNRLLVRSITESLGTFDRFNG